MKKIFTFVLALTVLAAMLAGCAGTTVVIGNCTCPTGNHDAVITETQTPEPQAPAVETSASALKTGLAVMTDLSDSASAADGEGGEAKYDITFAAVTVDENGVIQSCAVDAVSASIPFTASGDMERIIAYAFASKNELGEEYGMKAYAGSKYEWNEQVAAVAAYAVGKTAEELRSGAVNEAGKAKDADLASTATISIGGYVSAIEAAVANAKDLGAQAGDELKLVSLALADNNNIHGATEAEDGLAQMNCDVAALTMRGGVITSCYIDSVQPKVSFNREGAITSDLTAPVQTKGELGEAYGMKAWGGAKYEWNEQAASFAAYVTGKTPAEVEGIAVTDSNTPADVDLASSVTISIYNFKNLIAKAE